MHDDREFSGWLRQARDLGLTLVAVGRSTPPDFADELRA
jgi:hypothetical protein